MAKQVFKIINRNYVSRTVTPAPKKEEAPVAVKTTENKKTKKTKTMTENDLKLLEGAASDNNVVVLKKDRGLIERTESSKIILAEDNRQVLVD